MMIFRMSVFKTRLVFLLGNVSLTNSAHRMFWNKMKGGDPHIAKKAILEIIELCNIITWVFKLDHCLSWLLTLKLDHCLSWLFTLLACAAAACAAMPSSTMSTPSSASTRSFAAAIPSSRSTATLSIQQRNGSSWSRRAIWLGNLRHIHLIDENLQLWVTLWGHWVLASLDFLKCLKHAA